MFNKVILAGHAGKDAVLRHTKSGTPVCSFPLATNRRVKDGEPETEWHEVVCFDRLAEIAGEYVKKGSFIIVEGRIQTHKWTDKDGNQRSTVEIHPTQIELGPKKYKQEHDSSEDVPF